MATWEPKMKPAKLTRTIIEAVCKEVFDEVKFEIDDYPSRKWLRVLLKDDNLVEIEARKLVEFEDAVALTTGLSRTVSVGIWGGEKFGYYLYLSVEK